MGMSAILFNGAEPFDQIVTSLRKKGHMWNLVKFGQTALEKKTFKDFTILYMFIAHRQGHITPKILMVTK